MMPRAATIANLLWRVSCAPARRRMQRSLENPEAAQRSVFQRFLEKHAGCAFAREHGLHAGMSVAEFQERVPPRGYAEFLPWIEAMKGGARDVLCCEDLLAFEKTSGSTSAAKYIPFTQGLRSEFQEAVRAWMGDLFHRHPDLIDGPAWWLVSPLRHPREVTEAGTPVGLASDDEYLGAMERKIASCLWAVPPAVAVVSDLDASLDWTLRFLLQEPELRLISVWNPSLLTILWQRFMSGREKFLDQLENGTGPDSLEILYKKLRAMPQRARHLRGLREIAPHDIWPRLTVISAWADGEAAVDAQSARDFFPQAMLQAKGLLATEGVITIPWQDDTAAGVPALRSHFLEFIDAQTGKVFLVHELEQGRDYEVLLTTSGGLWRYRLGDIVRADGMAGKTSRLRWTGRCDDVCDLRGEKLHPQFVADIVASHCKGFRLLAPQRDANPPHYILFTTNAVAADMIDAALQTNPHYAHARNIGQLGPLRVFLIDEANPQETYIRHCVLLGQRAGSIKPVALHRGGCWAQIFAGHFLDSSP